MHHIYNKKELGWKRCNWDLITSLRFLAPVPYPDIPGYFPNVSNKLVSCFHINCQFEYRFGFDNIHDISLSLEFQLQQYYYCSLSYTWSSLWHTPIFEKMLKIFFCSLVWLSAILVQRWQTCNLLTQCQRHCWWWLGYLVAPTQWLQYFPCRLPILCLSQWTLLDT